MKLILKIGKFLAELFIFLAAGYFLIGATYYFGWTFLLNGTSLGNDHSSAMQSVFYLDRWSPYLPSWNYLWTGGMPSFALYPPMGMYLTLLVHQITSLSLIAASRVFLFLSIAVSAGAVALLGRMLTKNWFVGLLAGLIMLLSPDTWIWATYSGFLAAASTPPIFAFCLSAFVWAMQSRKPLPIALAAFLYGLSWLFHPLAGMLGTVVFFFLGWGYGVQFWGWRRSWKGIFWAAGIALLGAFLFAWWILPFFSREEVGGIGIAAKDMYRDTIRELIGLDAPKGSFVVGTFFSLGPIVLFCLGGLVVLFRRGVMLFAFLACLVALFIMTAPNYAQPIVEKLTMFWAPTNVRAALILRTLGSVVAAYGAVSLARPLFWLIEKIFRKIKENQIWRYSTEILCGLAGIAVVYLVVTRVILVPSYFNSPDWVGLGGSVYDGYGPLRNWIVTKWENGRLLVVNPTSDQYEPLYKDPPTILSEIPQIIKMAGQTNPARANYKSALALAFEKANLTEKDRIDIPPIKGEYAGAIGMYSLVSEIPSYMGTSLIQSNWGWQIDCTYWNSVCGPRQIEDLARWWGIKQVWLAEAQPPDIMARFEASPLYTLEKHVFNQPPEMINYLWYWYNFEDATGLASITNKPAILVIGNNPPNNDVYDQVFRGLTKADFGYKDAWSVRGQRFIDDYKLADLTRYEGIILHGYRYHDRGRAWDLLDKYVRQGGNLLVDTGWQYYSQDWGNEVEGKIQSLEMPKLLPVKKTTWEKIDQGEWNLSLGSDPLLAEVTTGDWGEPVYFGKPWGVAAANQNDVRQGATVLLTNNNKVLTAYWSVGKGKVLWTGFDYWGHLVLYKAVDERLMVQKMMAWLVGQEATETKLDFKRVNPDYIVINFQKLAGKNKLLFKEVATKNWRADLKDQDAAKISLPIAKAGPGWKMVFIPDKTTGGEIIFSYRRVGIEKLGIAMSLGSLLLVIFWIIASLFKKDMVLLKRGQALISKRVLSLRKDWANEEN